jgi:hypothetical protein
VERTVESVAELIIKEVQDISGAEIDLRGERFIKAIRLDALLAKVGGYEGTIRDPVSKAVRAISLLEWQNHDPATTWLTVSFEADIDAPESVALLEQRRIQRP